MHFKPSINVCDFSKVISFLVLIAPRHISGIVSQIGHD